MQFLRKFQPIILKKISLNFYQNFTKYLKKFYDNFRENFTDNF